MTIVAIHQPNFFPWLGYFDKIRRADFFVFLDEVDYPRAGSGGMGSWTNRVRIDVQGTARWITCPVRRLPLGAQIKEARIDESQDWRTRVRKTLASCYGRAPGYRDAMDLMGRLLDNRVDSLAEFNMHAIEVIARRLGFDTPFVRQSAVAHQGKGTELLISLVKAVGGTAYLAGGGASGYQLDDLFADHGVELVYQAFQPLPYGEPDTFIPGLSVIDFMMRTPPAGWSGA